MITKKNIPIWKTAGKHESTYKTSYMKIINNFEKNCLKQFPNSTILFLDNTYSNGNEVLNIIAESNYNVVFIFSLVDPPYTWHYLKELCEKQFPKVKFIFIGNDAPDFNIPFGLLWSFDAFPKYSIQQVYPTNFNHVYLNYNGKKHEHRIRFAQKIKDNSLESLGFFTLYSKEFQEQKDDFGLGNLDIWNSHFLNIVSETTFRIAPELLLSEKTFKPLVGLRPFIINGSPRYYTVLKELGFDCFDDIFPVEELSKNELTVEATMEKSHNIICNVIKELSQQNLKEKYKELYPRLLKNREHFFNIGQQLTKIFCEEDLVF